MNYLGHIYNFVSLRYILKDTFLGVEMLGQRLCSFVIFIDFARIMTVILLCL